MPIGRDEIVHGRIYVAKAETQIVGLCNIKFVLASEQLASGNWRVVELEQWEEKLHCDSIYLQWRVRLKEPKVVVHDKFVARWSRPKQRYSFRDRTRDWDDRHILIEEYDPNKIYLRE